MASSPAQKKKEETSLKLVRELISLQNNKQCFECQQRGPTYVDMTTCTFICTQCSGFLRGINPPHRVKSVSMTTFSTDEIQKLRNGGNEMARMIWMGNWDSRRDREPDKKDEQAFKEYLRDKYERKKWYKDPNEVKKEIASKNTDTTLTSKPATIPTLPPPVATTTVKQVPAAKPQQTPPTTKANETSLIDVFDSDPFAAKPPPAGGVSVFPAGPPPPLIGNTSSTSTNNEEFGAFTSSSGGTFNGAFLVPTNSSVSNVSNTQINSPAASTTGNDRYAALANLDKALNDIRLEEEEKQQQQQQQQQMMQQQQQMMQQQQKQQQMIQQQQKQQQMIQQQQRQQQMIQQQQQSNVATAGNPFGQLQHKESNPFLMGGPSPPVTGPVKPQGFGNYPTGPVSGQMVGYPVQQGMVGYSPTLLHQPVIGMPVQQPQQFGGFVPANQGMMIGGGGWQGQWGMIPTAAAASGGMPPQQFGFQTGPVPQTGGVPQIPPSNQFGNFVAAASTPPLGTPPMASNRSQFNWSNAQQTTPTTTISMFSQQTANTGWSNQSTTPTGWSNQLSKPAIDQSQQQPQASTTPTGWSTNMMMMAPSVNASSNWNASVGTTGNWAGPGGGATLNPFASTSKQQSGNPFM